MTFRPEEFGGNFQPDTNAEPLVKKLQQKLNKDKGVSPKLISNPVDTFNKSEVIQPLGFSSFDNPISLN